MRLKMRPATLRKQWRITVILFRPAEQWITSTNGACSSRSPAGGASSHAARVARTLAAGGHARGRGPRGRLGTRLLNRTTRSVSLTGDGERYLERSRRALAEFDALESPVDADAPLDRPARRSPRPCCSASSTSLPDRRGVPRAHIRSLDVRLLLLDRVVSLAEEGLDVGVRIGALPDSSLRARLVGHVRSVLCASPAYLERAGVPRSPDALTKHAVHRADRRRRRSRTAGRSPRPGRRERTVSVRARLDRQHRARRRSTPPSRGSASCACCRTRSIGWSPTGTLRIVLDAFEPQRRCPSTSSTCRALRSAPRPPSSRARRSVSRAAASLDHRRRQPLRQLLDAADERVGVAQPLRQARG